MMFKKTESIHKFKNLTKNNSILKLQNECFRNYVGVNGGRALRPDFYKAITVQKQPKRDSNRKKIKRKDRYNYIHSPGPYSRYHPSYEEVK